MYYCLSKKAPGSEKFFSNFFFWYSYNCLSNRFDILILSFSLKDRRVYGQKSPNFSPKISSKIIFFTHPWLLWAFCKYWRACNFFAKWLGYTRPLFSNLNISIYFCLYLDVYIQQDPCISNLTIPGYICLYLDVYIQQDPLHLRYKL